MLAVARKAEEVGPLTTPTSVEAQSSGAKKLSSKSKRVLTDKGGRGGRGGLGR